jgi:hypothetical protein
MEPPGNGVMTNDVSTATNQNLLRKGSDLIDSPTLDRKIFIPTASFLISVDSCPRVILTPNKAKAFPNKASHNAQQEDIFGKEVCRSAGEVSVHILVCSPFSKAVSICMPLSLDLHIYSRASRVRCSGDTPCDRVGYGRGHCCQPMTSFVPLI